MTQKTLSFALLRRANALRHAEWPGANRIDLTFRGLEFAGEAGELANSLKKMIRIRNQISGTTESYAELLQACMDELADVVITADLIAMDLGVDLGAAVAGKFDKTSEKHGMDTRIQLLRAAQNPEL